MSPTSSLIDWTNTSVFESGQPMQHFDYCQILSYRWDDLSGESSFLTLFSFHERARDTITHSVPSSGASFNLPRFCTSAKWNPNATTFANASVVGVLPYSVSVDTKNNVYVSARSVHYIVVFNGLNSTVVRNITNGLVSPRGFFVTSNGDVYVDNGKNKSRIEKWTPNATSGVTAMYVPSSCYGVFVDIAGDLYCSMDGLHLVIKSVSNNTGNFLIIVAGNGTAGSSSTQLYTPQEIFVDLELNLFVAECGNNRIQRFKRGQLNASTVAGNGANGTIALYCPSGITFDADGYMFIVDLRNNRVVRSGPNGFQCVVGCTNSSGPASNQLNQPRSLAFDVDGNLLVIDTGNRRVQRFLFRSDSCGEYSKLFNE